MVNSTFISWIVLLMLSIAPVGTSQILEAQESEVDGQTRYSSIATDLAEVVFAEDEVPLFDGESGKVKTYLTMLAIARFESGFRRDVDYGVGHDSKGDLGNSWCMMQIQMGHQNKKGFTSKRIRLTDDGLYIITSDANDWGGEDLIADRQKCFKTALSIVRESFYKCRFLNNAESLRAYASGSCAKGSRESHSRLALAGRWFNMAQYTDIEATVEEEDDGTK
jgi:hypothetical protein